MVVQEGHFLYPQFGGIHHIYANPKAFAALTGDTRERTVSDGGARCHACHRARKSHDYVLHDWRP